MQKKQNEEQNQEIALDEKEKSEIVEIPLIQNLIYVVRGKQEWSWRKKNIAICFH